MPAATAHATIRHDALGLRAARAHIAHLLWRSGGSCRACFVLFVCEANEADCYYLARFWCSFADSECAFGAGCQLRLRMARSGMMHRGCGRPVRTSRTHWYHRAAPLAPVLYFLCAKETTPIIWWACFWCCFADSDCAFGAGCQLRLRMARSGIMHRGCGRPVRTLRTFCCDRAAPSAPVLHFLCAKQMTPIIWGLLLVLLC